MENNEFRIPKVTEYYSEEQKRQFECDHVLGVFEFGIMTVFVNESSKEYYTGADWLKRYSYCPDCGAKLTEDK